MPQEIERGGRKREREREKKKMNEELSSTKKRKK
jgi:hypothetical protein